VRARISSLSNSAYCGAPQYAEFERDILRQRVNAGLKAARRRGRVGGRPKALDEADLKKARAMLQSGEYSKVQVADELEVSRHTLWRALSVEKTK
jgi:DNA invertase Pin-like site-specific DNA recombinase